MPGGISELTKDFRQHRIPRATYCDINAAAPLLDKNFSK
jgi:hypothetical protein